MSEVKSIDRKRGDTDPFGFEGLKDEGLRLVQEMSGNLWTDYNLHDPGVTILDQLCYALSDLIYRADFPVEDFLAGEGGEIDCGDLALHPPETVFPCRPTTLVDYRRIICDRLPEIDDVWLKIPEKGPAGLYRIMVRPGPGGAGHETELVERAGKVYAQFRNLCEDLDGITVVKEDECDLHARIEVTGEMEPAVILAGIYHACSLHIAAALSPVPILESLKTGLELDELLSGPEVQHGIILEAALDKDREEIVIADLFTVIKGVPGVSQVKELWLSKEGKDYFEAVESRRETAVLRLRIPTRRNEMGVRLESASGRELTVPYREFRACFSDLDFVHRSGRSSPQDLSSVYPLPRGVSRPIGDYYSIQHQFPASYGINTSGTPQSAPPEARGKAAQLKGYLLLFDQVMANYSTNLRSIRRLFSLADKGRESYFSQVVKNDGDPPLSGIYPDNPGEALTALLRRYDPHRERQGRVLDYLLALYGETFPRNSLRSFNVYGADHEGDETLLGAQCAFLRWVVAAGRDRGGAFDYTAGTGDLGNVAGYKRRISLLLGFKDFLHRRLAAVITRHGLRLVAAQSSLLSSGNEEMAADEMLLSIPLAGDGGITGAEELLGVCRGYFPFLRDTLPEGLLRCGINLENFRMTERKEGGVWVACRDEESRKWRPLAIFPDSESAVFAVNALRRLCIRLNIESEGVHVLEHILLRPLAAPRHEGEPVPEDFYPFRMSLLFAGWSARCHDGRFREMAENLVRMNTPAHIYPDIHWLDPEAMTEFERLFKEWLGQRGKAGADPEQVNAVAHALIRFLLRLGSAGVRNDPKR